MPALSLTELTRTIRLKHCEVRLWHWGCETVFPDGSSVPSVPHESPHYWVISHRCGYGDDILAYCVEHDFAHAFVAEKIFGGPSAVLSGIAQGRPLKGSHAAYEELAAQTFQRWLRANERPIIGGCDWDGWKAEALELLDGA